ncbi:hypothetical protein CHLNCDRAFT_139358 [Chlorella variabilis]|uniref:tRNA (adenine(58)-N(1))-methyltransferase non-catalytic subunit TRM6 n=1 Tax=Chlorella variabilis TaxID=554065 RepID=E1ZQ38_CHLVA|nr:hypothetical protein CHLNCDRAFT_139358 [Chlorella variabilis]EFN52089.1 hypothetical protein CHLNCDRAFT_139358 [Chlorella variabilis]|eukprot:XP_005844191.1 hypothetical protein CHLNCDRAFT_139358 [Chlorella variabilis]
MFALAADGKSLERIQYTPLADWDLPSPEIAPGFNTRTNADLVDSGGAQALSAADIEAMKAEGAAGADIVAALTANSATFAAKTEFSQDKYRKKKARKYIQVATVRRPTAAAVCEAYFSTSPAKTAYLRADALALLLSLANIGAHGRVLVVENCGGLVTAAVAERLGGHGGVTSAWAGGKGTKQPSLAIWRHLNLSSAQRAAMRFTPLSEVLAECRQQQQQEQAAEQAKNKQQHGEQQPPAGAAQLQQQQLQPPFNSCILAATNLSPLALVRHVLPLLAPSASLAVFCPWQQPLAEAMDALRGQGEVAGLALHESWWREMQVLPLRTHPTMNMSHGGGSILSGTVLATDQQRQQQ